ncbi:MAG TPA: hypothetical protein VHA74_00750 [Candidatus Dojkabacteria bacterium]|nr:hypothetical protein [Candidatus Dojkabacteria bacterium]
MNDGYKLCSIEGVNGVGKGVLAERALFAMEAFSVHGYRDFGLKPFRTAFVNEPPDLPLKEFSSYPGVINPDGSLSTWRDLLKKGKLPSILEVASTGENRDQRFADGFLTARMILEDFMRNEFTWDFNSKLPNFVKMVPDFASLAWGLKGYSNVPFDQMVIKDRGSASTAVFQGQDPWVRDLMIDIYNKGELQREDLTVVVMPSDYNNWANGGVKRENDVDVHDAGKMRQYEAYHNLRRDWLGIFSNEIVYLENDPTGNDFDLGSLGIIMPILFDAIRHNEKLYWFDEGDGINSIKMDMFRLKSLLLTRIHRNDFSDCNPTVAPMAFFHTLDKMFGPERLFLYEGIPLTFVSGDMGIIQISGSLDEHKLEFILVHDLSNKVEKYTFNGYHDRNQFLDQLRIG